DRDTPVPAVRKTVSHLSATGTDWRVVLQGSRNAWPTSGVSAVWKAVRVGDDDPRPDQGGAGSGSLVRNGACRRSLPADLPALPPGTPRPRPGQRVERSVERPCIGGRTVTSWRLFRLTR